MYLSMEYIFVGTFIFVSVYVNMNELSIMCACMYVCTYACIYVCMHLYMYPCTYLYLCVSEASHRSSAAINTVV